MRRRIAGQRNWHRLVPASSGAKAPLACEDRTLVGCARASFQGCRSRQATPRPREARHPLATGRVDGGPAPEGSQGPAGVQKASRTGVAVAKPRTRRKPEPGVREGVAGQGFLGDGRHPRRLVRLVSFTRSGRGSSRRPPRVRTSRERRDTSGGGDRDVRGTDRTHRDGKTTPTAVTPRRRVAHRSESL